VDAVWTLTDRTLFSSVLDHLLASEQAKRNSENPLLIVQNVGIW
jgi:hypothetical protein